MEYYNDFQNMVRSDNLTYLIDRFHLRTGRDCVTTDTKQAMNELLEVLDSVKHCRPHTYDALIKLSKIISSCSPTQLGLFIHIIGGGALIEYAISEGITEQAAHQMWWRLVGKNPELSDVHKRRTKHGTQRILGASAGKRTQQTSPSV